MRRATCLALVMTMLLTAGLPVALASDGDQGPDFIFGDRGGARGPVNDTDSEPNNEAAEATNLTGNVSVPGTLTFNDAADFYRIAMNNTTWPNRLNASLEFTSGDPSAVAYLAILDLDEFRLDQVLCTGTRVNASALALFQGHYYIGILWEIQNQQGATITYTLNVSLEEETLSPDGNDGPGDAPEAGDDYMVQGDLDEIWDAADFYKVHMEKGEEFSDVALLHVSIEASLDVAIEIYTGTLDFIRQVNDADSGGTEMAYFIAPSTGDYYFRLWANTGEGTYDLMIRTGTGWGDNDNEIANATTIQGEQPVTGNLTDDLDPDDFYGINLTVGEEITVNLTVLDHNASLEIPVFNLWLYNESSFVKNSTSSSAPEKTIWHEAEKAGWYYIRTAASDMSFGDYRIDVEVLSPPVILPHDSTISVDEDTSGHLDLSTIFSDPQGGGLAYGFSGNESVSIGIEAHNLTVASLEENWYGSDTVTLSATNAADKTAWTDVTFNFLPINDAPVAKGQPLEAETDEDTAYEYTMSFLETKFVDVDGDELNISFLPNENVTATVTNDTATLTPAQDWFGTENLTIVAMDPEGLNATLQLNLTVLPTEDRPVGQDIGIVELEEDGTTSLDLDEYFTDPDGEDLSYDGYSEGDEGGERNVDITLNGSMADITLAEDWFGEEELTFVATDSANNTVTVSATVVVTPVNDGPVVNQVYWDIYTSESWWVVEDRSRTFDLTKLFQDADGDELTFTLQSAGTHLGAEMSGDKLLIEPDANWFGVEEVRVSAEDPAGVDTETELPITVVNDNDGPVLSNGAVSPRSGNEETDFEFSVIVKDIDGDEPVVMLVIGQKEYRMAKQSGEIDEGALYTYTTKLDGGNLEYSFKADDNQHTATSKTTLEGGSIEVEGTEDEAGNHMFYLALLVIFIILAGLLWAAYNRSARMKEFDDTWEDDEDELLDEEILEEE